MVFSSLNLFVFWGVFNIKKNADIFSFDVFNFEKTPTTFLRRVQLKKNADNFSFGVFNLKKMPTTSP